MCFVWLCMLPWLAIESPSEMPPANQPQAQPAASTPAWVAPVEDALDANPFLLRHHRGYLHYLQTHPKLAGFEESFNELRVQYDFGRLHARFDEALRELPEAADAMARFYTALGANPDLREEVDMLRRTEVQGAGEGDYLAQALDWIRANPDEAMGFLRQVSGAGGGPSPEQLYSWINFFSDRQDYSKALGDQLGQVLSQPGAHQQLLPWWSALVDYNEASGGAFAAMSAHFLEHPHHFWVWHQRELALSEDPQAGQWIRYLFRSARRAPLLERDYARYLQFLRQHPGAQAEAEARWRASYGRIPTWPPITSPPTLRKLPPAEAPSWGFEDDAHRNPRGGAPRKPGVSRPRKPERPEMPRRPRRPELRQSTGGHLEPGERPKP